MCDVNVTTAVNRHVAYDGVFLMKAEQTPKQVRSNILKEKKDVMQSFSWRVLCDIVCCQCQWNSHVLTETEVPAATAKLYTATGRSFSDILENKMSAAVAAYRLWQLGRLNLT